MITTRNIENPEDPNVQKFSQYIGIFLGDLTSSLFPLQKPTLGVEH